MASNSETVTGRRRGGRRRRRGGRRFVVHRPGAILSHLVKIQSFQENGSKSAFSLILINQL
jgi:hypothetical protein